MDVLEVDSLGVPVNGNRVQIRVVCDTFTMESWVLLTGGDLDLVDTLKDGVSR
jgi:hypothetical protein